MSSSLQDTAALAVAVSQLNEVHSLIQAIQNANIGAAASAADSASVPPAGTATSGGNRPAAVYDQHIEPANKSAQYVVYSPTIVQKPVVKSSPCAWPPPLPGSEPPTAPQAEPSQTKPVFQPPWDTMPWPVKTPPTPLLKIVVQQPDIPQKGLLIDLFF